VVNTHLFTANLWGRLAGLRRRDWGLVVTLHNLDTWRGPMHRLADVALSGVPDRYVAVGPAVGRYYQREGVAAGKLSVIPNAIRWNGTHCPTPLVNGKPIVRACGRLVPQKGFDVLLEAAEALKRRGTAFELEIIGEGPQRPALEAMRENRGLSESVRLLGARDDARELIAAADVFVMPSLREGLPLVLLEAMHAGRPIVATRLPALEGVAEDGRESVLVEPGSPQALARGIERVLHDRCTARAMGEAGRRHAQKSFSMRRAAEEYLEVYRQARGARKR
jgi:glycosyltransferase involved in cell wall biosynthesis